MDFIKKQHENNNIFTKLVIALVILCIAALFVMGIIFYKISSKGKAVSSLTNNLEIEIKKEQDFKTMRGILFNIEGDRKKLDTYFITKDDIVGLLEKIESIGNKTNVSMVFDSVSETSDGNELKIQITTEGEFDDIFDTLFLLELLPFKISFENIFIEKDEFKGLWEGRFLLTILSYINE